MYFLKIGTEALPTPSFYTVESEDIDSTDSCRSDETGQMHRRRIRAAVKTISVKWVLNAEAARLLIEKLSEPELSVTMLDTSDMSYVRKQMFASGLKSAFYQQQNNMESSSYWEVSCRLIEY